MLASLLHGMNQAAQKHFQKQTDETLSMQQRNFVRHLLDRGANPCKTLKEHRVEIAFDQNNFKHYDIATEEGARSFFLEQCGVDHEDKDTTADLYDGVMRTEVHSQCKYAIALLATAYLECAQLKH